MCGFKAWVQKQPRTSLITFILITNTLYCIALVFVCLASSSLLFYQDAVTMSFDSISYALSQCTERAKADHQGRSREWIAGLETCSVLTGAFLLCAASTLILIWGAERLSNDKTAGALDVSLLPLLFGCLAINLGLDICWNTLFCLRKDMIKGTGTGSTTTRCCEHTVDANMITVLSHSG